MFDGEFLKSLFNNPYIKDSIKNTGKDFYIFLKECFICDLILNYNKTNANHIYWSNEIIPIYYEILKENETFLPEETLEINDSTQQKKYRIINRNIFSSNSDNKNGLQNRRELECKRIGRNLGYKLSDELISESYKNGIIDRMIFMEKYSYLFNLRSLLFSTKYLKCSCGNEHNIMIKIKKINAALPLPISDHIEIKCINCYLSNEQADFKNIIKRR